MCQFENFHLHVPELVQTLDQDNYLDEEILHTEQIYKQTIGNNKSLVL